MITKTETLYGCRVTENPIPTINANPSIVLTGNGKRFGISRDQLSTHCLLLGSTGTGKTNAILHFVKQLKASMKSDDVMLVFDSKLDFVKFHNADDYIISNQRNSVAVSADWNIFMDIVADGWDKEAIILNADEIAEVVFSDSIANSSQPFFPTAARDVFAAILKAMTFLGISDMDYRIKHLNNSTLHQYLLTINATKLAEFLNGFSELKGVLKYIGDGRSDQALGVFAELQSITSRLFVKCFGKNGRFSVRKAERQRNGKTLFIEYDPACGLSFQPIYRILVDLFLKEALSPSKKRGHVYIIYDELKMLPSLNHFEDALNFGRSLGISVIAGIQSMEQLYELYGEYGGRNIASGFQNVFCFRTSNAASREYIKGLFGRNICAYQYIDPANKPREEIREGNAVEDWNITVLAKGEAIIGLDGEKPFRFYIERFGWEYGAHF